jgi:hypothetical protein
MFFRMLRAALGLAVVAALSCSLAADKGRGSPIQRARVIDRTVSCSIPSRAGARIADVRGQSGSRRSPAAWIYLPTVGVGERDGGSLVWVAAGNPREPDPASGVVHPPHRLSIRVDGCRRAPRVPFSRRGLSGGRAGQFGDDWECEVGGRVVVRVRATFRTPAALRSSRVPWSDFRFLQAAGTVVQASLAVRSESGKVLAYGDVDEGGRARLFTASSCFPD